MHFLTSAVAALRVAFLACLTGSVLLCGVTAATAQSNGGDSGYFEKEVKLEVLIEALDEYGRWRQHDVYGDVWIPEVGDDWRPYTIGQWAYDEGAGWTWVSDEPFGWVVYHYGRWSRDDDFGWFWVPGTTWAPAWVAWREADEHIGWAPLPPEPPGYTGPPYEHTVIYDEPRYETFWVFATYSLFVEPRVHRHIFWHRHRHYRRVYRKSRRGNHARWRHRRVVNRGVPLRRLRERAKRDVRPAHAIITHRKKDRGERHRHDGRRLVNVYRPEADAKPQRVRRNRSARRFHNVDDRRVKRQGARSREANVSTHSRARPIEKGQPSGRKAPQNSGDARRSRAERPGNVQRQKARRDRRPAANRQAKPKTPRGRAGPRANAQRKVAPQGKAQRRAVQRRKASRRGGAQRSTRPGRAAQSRPRGSRHRARPAQRTRPQAARRGPAAGRQSKPQTRNRGRGGHRR